MPEDADAVVSALRLGWYMAEVRGRNRPGGPPGREPEEVSVANHPLLLSFERSQKEMRLQAQAVLGALAAKLDADVDPADGSKYCQELDSQAARLADLREHGQAEAQGAWETLSALIYKFDAHIQDVLTTKSDIQAGGYQLGRGLAECYWALDPSTGSNTEVAEPASWDFLLGAQRCQELARLLGRMSGYLAPYTPSAIDGSLMAWKVIARVWTWREDAQEALYRQVCTWYELVVLGQDPTTLIPPYARLKNLYVAKRALWFFSGRLILVAGGIAGLIALVIALGSGASNDIVTALLAILAAAGLSTAGLSARRFAREVNVDLTTYAVMVMPPLPSISSWRTRKRVHNRIVAAFGSRGS